MSGSFEKSVKLGTKIKLAPPKSKYVTHILVATHAGEAGVAEVFRALQNRLRDSTWTIVFKALIITHLMIREGEPNVTLKFIAESPSKLAISNFSEVQVQGTNIRHYHTYLIGRSKAYRDTKIDWVREGSGRLKRQTVDKGLLRETETVQHQISALLKCDLFSNEPENEITMTAFRLLTMDVLILFHVMNEGTINVLEHYFEMSKFDAERALRIYKTFSKQTSQVVEFLGIARQHESSTRLEIPNLKHAPTSLTASLEEYINDPDFEINRRQYLAQQDAKKGKTQPTRNGAGESADELRRLGLNKATLSQSFPEPKTAQAAPVKSEHKAPAPDLIDFFDSIEQNPQSMTGQAQAQSSNFQNSSQYFQPAQLQGPPSHQPNVYPPNGQPQLQAGGSFATDSPFSQGQAQPPEQQMFNGAGFGGYPQQIFGQQPNSSITQKNGADLPQIQQLFGTGQQQPQPYITSQQQQLFSNGQQQQPFGNSQQQQPFSTVQQHQQQMPSNTGQQAQWTNPFRQSMMPQPTGSTNLAFTNPAPMPSPLVRQPTNPFARSINTQSPAQGLPFTSLPPIPDSVFTSPPPNQARPFTSSGTSLPQQRQLQAVQPLQPMRTGTNPFARDIPPPQQQQLQLQKPLQPQPQQQAAPSIVPNQTGSTNPFRQSAYPQGWQTSQGSMGGLEQLDTVPVFPRPGQQFQPSQQAWS